MSNKDTPDTLPSLPVLCQWVPSDRGALKAVYTTDQMLAYAAQAVAERNAALRAEVAALLEMLAEARDTIDTLPGYPKGAELCDRIDVVLEAARAAGDKND
jgi:hypothetical protein